MQIIKENPSQSSELSTWMQHECQGLYALGYRYQVKNNKI